MPSTDAWAVLETPIGPITVVAGVDGIHTVELRTRLDPARGQGPDAAIAAEHLAEALTQLEQYFAGERTDFDLELDWSRTSEGFRRSVLQELVTVPYGSVVSYGELALRVGHPKAMRAVGTTMATNPLPIVVPCHRVVRTGGAIGNYGGGVDAKAWLLDLEST